VTYWEIIADNLSKAGQGPIVVLQRSGEAPCKVTGAESEWFELGELSYGYVSAVDSQGRTIWIVDAHCDDGNRFIVHADEMLTASVELESAIRRATAA
jgi:hypothetical protein